ncbi:M12 family metallo-peptidase [Polaribacter sp.]|nr:M12 family metallo-peptidase [Polaribacter sp.]
MKQVYPTAFLVLFIFFFSFVSAAQTQKWSLTSENAKTISQEKLMIRKEMPTTYQLYNLNESAFRSKIAAVKQTKNKTIQIPTSQGLKTFYIEEASNFSKELAAKYVNIKTYSGKQVDNNAIKMRFSKGLDGYHFAVYEPGKPSFYVDSYTKDNKKLIAYSKKNLQKKASNFTCEVLELGAVKTTSSFENKITNDGLLRTFRLALATTGEYSQYQLNRLGISASATKAVKKEAVLSAVNATITRVSGVFENDLGVKFELVADNDALIFLDAENDGLSNDDPSSLINESQSKIDQFIGDSSYDVGHTFSTGAGGLAGLGVVCITNQKGRGVTGIGAPFGDEFDIDFVAHEFGHQFGANHTFNGTSGNCSGSNRNNNTAVEPGSGTTIMGYAGICSGQNVLNDSHDNFHSISIAEMTNIISSSATCAGTSNTGNTAPIANAGLDYSIPKSTPFILKGVATDVDAADVLTYNWEQIDNEVGFAIPPVSANGGGAMFRSLPSSMVSSRFMPTLNTVISGNTSSTWEVLPSVERVLDFSLTVRDNHSGAGGTARDDVRITVADAYAFTVTSQNTTTIWNAGSTQNITWSKGTSDVAPINCKNINIKLSEDGGLTFPITLISNTANDGSENIIVPNNVTTRARILIEAADNIFYNVNDVNFEIESTSPSFVLKNNSGDLSACNSGDQTVNYTLNLDFINGFSEDVTFVTSGQPAGSVVAFSPTTLNSDGDVVMSVSNLDGVMEQEYTINIQGNSASINQDIDVLLRITASSLGVVTLSSPADGAANVSLTGTLRWQAEVNASSYVVQVASDADFNTLITNKTVITDTYVISGLDADTLYYWRVKANNSCNEGVFSSVFSFTTENPEYCISAFTDEVGGTEHITNVTFNTINNNSGNDTFDGYQDFTAVNTDVSRESNHTISVTFDTGGFQDHCYVFIDWNKDFVFDKNTERYDLGSKLDDVSTATLSIRVPLDAQFGKTRMRVLIEYYDSDNASGDGPCDADHLTEWGETEDYSVTIIDNTASIEELVFEGFNLFPNPTKGAFTLNLKLVNTDKVSVQLYDVRGRLITAKNYYNLATDFSEKIFFEAASSGLYLLKVTNGNKQTTRKLIIQ